MTWLVECQNLFDQYIVRLDNFAEYLKELETTVQAIEQCLWLTDHGDLG